MAKHFVSMGFVDASNEPGSIRYPVELTPGGGEITALITATIAATGMRTRDYTDGLYTLYSSAPGLGQREMKLLIRMHDSVNQQKFSLSLPGGNPTTTPLISGTDFVDLAGTNAAALKAAIEACVVTPWYENTVVVDSIELTRGSK